MPNFEAERNALIMAVEDMYNKVQPNRVHARERIAGVQRAITFLRQKADQMTTQIPPLCATNKYGEAEELSIQQKTLRAAANQLENIIAEIRVVHAEPTFEVVP